MTSFNINAALQLLPVGTQKHPYEWVDGVIGLIEQSGLNYEVTPFNTSVEGSYPAVKALIDHINDWLMTQGCEEWLLLVQYQFKNGAHVVASHKTAPYVR
ncbi:MAG: thiamine-binding protein [Bacteroidetes bacterium]|nr:MAG: thiamine-binding protein [Bacteroidota bacterium]